MSSRVTSLVLAAVLAVGLAGCDGGEPQPDPSPSAQGSESLSATASASESGSPSVAPATGPLIEANALTLHLYEGPKWIIDSMGSVISGSHRIAEGSVDAFVSDLATTSTDVEGEADAAWVGRKNDEGARRLENRVINGVECWAISTAREDYRTYEVGGVHNGYQFTIGFEVPSDWPEADQRIEEMLASIEWK